MKKIFALLFLLTNYVFGYTQVLKSDTDKCGVYSPILKDYTSELGDKWGYSYADLEDDISVWEMNEFIQVNSIGTSVQSREMYELTVTDFTISDSQKHRIYIHARTHPGEVQAFYVVQEMLSILISDTRMGEFLRENFIFYIIPMSNPDGVELENSRENANVVDLESNWDNVSPQVEVQNLRNRFSELMQEQNPIEIALNMHSAIACKRYFVYHDPFGTSPNFAQKEREFIASVQSQFVGEIEPYTYYMSWQTSTPTKYPESWWWNNYGEQVLALTYEDMNCSSAGNYNKTANAILYGIIDYMNIGFVGVDEITNSKFVVFPNPFSENVYVQTDNQQLFESITITDSQGKIVRMYSNVNLQNSSVIWDGLNQNGIPVQQGIYILTLKNTESNISLPLIKK